MNGEERDELPDGWATAKVSELLNLFNGFAFKPAHWKGSGLPIIRIQNLNNADAPFNYCPDAIPEKCRVSSGDLLFAWSGTPGTSFGAHIWRGGEAWLNQHIFRVVFPEKLLDKQFIRHAINQNLEQYIHDAHGGAGLAHITKGMFESSELLIPPLAEQRRIVSAVETVLAKVNAARERLNRVPAILKRFRQAVLSAACSGRLTADWRERNPSPDLGRSYRAQLLKHRSALIATMGKNSNSQTPADADYLEDVPESWAICSLDEISSVITSGSRDWSKYYGNGSGTFLMAQNVKPGKLDLSFRQPVNPPQGDRDRQRSQVAVGDVLVTIVGANTGDVCFVEQDLPEHYVCQSVALVRPINSTFAPYLNYFLNSPTHGRRQFDGYIYGEGRPHLSFDHIRQTAIAVPPLTEQQEIVLRVGEAFELADLIEARLIVARQMADQLTQAVLAKAFRGELVPTEAALARREKRTYEPAADLLARIRAEREKPVTSTPAKRKRS